VILVASAPWIAYLRDEQTSVTEKFEDLAAENIILVGDMILLEVLRGARHDAHAAWLERRMRRYEIVPLLDDALAVRAARNDRILRSLGITIRKTAVLIIGTFCMSEAIGCSTTTAISTPWQSISASWSRKPRPLCSANSPPVLHPALVTSPPPI